ncbi:MAG: SemiSWEET transporter [Cyclobacteriaceae bacterium]|nr:SemiSWEET transporter [Cyclobacteriaceae bacterium]
METEKLIGLLAGFFTTVSFLPQVFKTWKTKSAGDLSMVMLAVYVTGVAGWMVYGIVRHDFPVILWNAITLALSSVLIYFKVHFRRG